MKQFVSPRFVARCLRGKFLLLLSLWLSGNAAFSQNVEFQITAPTPLKGRKAILLTRERVFASTVHSIKLNEYPVGLQMSPDLLPDLYELNVSKMKGSLSFFLEPGTVVKLDTNDISKSLVTNSKSNPDWQIFQSTIQRPSDYRIAQYSIQESRARKQNKTDSLNYWAEQKATEYHTFIQKTGEFIQNHPKSYVSLYLLKSNWYAFKDKHLLEKLDASLAGHRNYQFLKMKKKGT